MQIQAIENAIKELESAETTVKNVAELADLYIIRDHHYNLQNSRNSTSENELKDILPQYKEYVRIKRRYQRGETGEEPVITAMQGVCRELVEFIGALYSCTDLPEERKKIKSMIQFLNSDYYNK